MDQDQHPYDGTNNHSTKVDITPDETTPETPAPAPTPAPPKHTEVPSKNIECFEKEAAEYADASMALESAQKAHDGTGTAESAKALADAQVSKDKSRQKLMLKKLACGVKPGDEPEPPATKAGSNGTNSTDTAKPEDPVVKIPPEEPPVEPVEPVDPKPDENETMPELPPMKGEYTPIASGLNTACDKDNGGCSKNAACSATKGSLSGIMDQVHCECNSGFTGNGITCAKTKAKVVEKELTEEEDRDNKTAIADVTDDDLDKIIQNVTEDADEKAKRAIETKADYLRGVESGCNGTNCTALKGTADDAQVAANQSAEHAIEVATNVDIVKNRNGTLNNDTLIKILKKIGAITKPTPSPKPEPTQSIEGGWVPRWQEPEEPEEEPEEPKSEPVNHTAANTPIVKVHIGLDKVKEVFVAYAAKEDKLQPIDSSEAFKKIFKKKVASSEMIKSTPIASSFVKVVEKVILTEDIKAIFAVSTTAKALAAAVKAVSAFNFGGLGKPIAANVTISLETAIRAADAIEVAAEEIPAVKEEVTAAKVNGTTNDTDKAASTLKEMFTGLITAKAQNSSIANNKTANTTIKEADVAVTEIPDEQVGEIINITRQVDDLLEEEQREVEEVKKEGVEDCNAAGAACGGEDPEDDDLRVLASAERLNDHLLSDIFKFLNGHEEFMALVQIFNNTFEEFKHLNNTAMN
jgi:hypothetical protein